jgi:DNA polymerase elongation subunit (family B)
MTPESKKRYATDQAKLDFILDFYKRFLNDEQNRWVGDDTNKRHGDSVQEFELELVCKSLIGLAKKKYVKGVVFEKGHFMVDNPKLKSTGVEIVKSTTPALCRKFMKEIVNDLLYKYDDEKKEEFIYYLNNRLREMYNEFRNAPVDDISNSV